MQVQPRQPGKGTPKIHFGVATGPARPLLDLMLLEILMFGTTLAFVVGLLL